MFQSLFCWMLFWKSFVHWLLLPDLLGFNPYSVGCYSGSKSGEEDNIRMKEFQSLFCWMLFWKVAICNTATACRRVSILILLDVILEVTETNCSTSFFLGFNPYSVGCYSGSFFLFPLPSLFCTFQSLFCWMLFWKC